MSYLTIIINPDHCVNFLRHKQARAIAVVHHYQETKFAFNVKFFFNKSCSFNSHSSALMQFSRFSRTHFETCAKLYRLMKQSLICVAHDEIHSWKVRLLHIFRQLSLLALHCLISMILNMCESSPDISAMQNFKFSWQWCKHKFLIVDPRVEPLLPQILSKHKHSINTNNNICRDDIFVNVSVYHPSSSSWTKKPIF